MQFWPPDNEHMVLETCSGMKWTYCETNILCTKLVNYWDKYTEMHVRQNAKSEPKVGYLSLSGIPLCVITL